VAPHRQHKLADAIPGSTIHPAPIDHGGCVAEADRFVPVLVDAVRDVISRSGPRPQLSGTARVGQDGR